MKKIIVFVLTFVLASSVAVQAQIANLLQNKTAFEKASIKAREITKLNFPKYTDSGTGITIEIKDGKVNQINGGIELYARAWEGAKQLGFGKDGRTEWEHFKIFNPPIMVDDPNGNVIRKWTNKDGKLQQRKLRDDPAEAIKKSLAHTIKVSSKEGTSIIKGSIGNTTSTFYPQAGEGGGNVTTDAYVGPNAQNVSWATIRSSATGSITDGVNASNPFIQAFGSSTTDQWKRLFRSILTFDTSSIPDTDSISAAVLSIVGVSKSDLQSNTPNIDVYTATPAANNVIAASDYLNVGSTSQTGSPNTYASWTTDSSTYNDFTFNATGRGNISKTGVSPFAMRNANYDVSGTAPTWGNNDTYSLVGLYADQAGTASDPKLVVVHSDITVAPAESNLWQKRSFEGNGFITTTNEITVTSTSETDFVLIKNPSASGKLHRSNEFTLTVRTENQDAKVRIYKNSTITSNGTQITVNNVRTSGFSPVSLAYYSPTISSRGTLMATYSRNAGSLDRPFDLSLYLEQNESFLITVEGATVRNDYILTYTFAEE
ncbi:MAG: hypothetical protein Q7R61_01310 [bacterium]|nr:hypothetical protein [bacterium]